MQVLSILALSGMLALLGCSRESTKAANLRDAELEQTARTKLAAEPQLVDAVRVSARADKNEIALSGTVRSEQLRTEAVELVKSSRDGLIVTDTIDVKPGELSRKEYTEEMARKTREKAQVIGDKIGDTLNDAWLYAKITAKLIGDSQTPVRKINVDVFDGVVTLHGEVNSEDVRAEAERIAGTTDGVKRVRNYLKVAIG